MNLTEIQNILKKTNYHIDYNFINGTGYIDISWDNNQKYQIEYNKENKIIKSNWKNLCLPCPEYAVPCMAYMILADVCKTNNQYPDSWVFFKNKNNKCGIFYFDILSDNEEILNKADSLQNILIMMSEEGICSDIISMAKENNIWEGIKPIIEFQLGISIHDNPN